jgi:hypothetical protein
MTDADPPGFLAMSSVLRLHQLMTSIIEHELKVDFKLSPTDYLVLKTLQMSDTAPACPAVSPGICSCTPRR